jgi:hypothetical protein
MLGGPAAQVAVDEGEVEGEQEAAHHGEEGEEAGAAGGRRVRRRAPGFLYLGNGFACV